MDVYTARARDTGLLREPMEIKVKAERVTGQMLIAMAVVGERNVGGRPTPPACRRPLAKAGALGQQAFTHRLDRTVRKAIAAASGAGTLERKAAT